MELPHLCSKSRASSKANDGRQRAAGKGYPLAAHTTFGYVPAMANNPLTQHLEEAGESYGEHFVVASSFGAKMIVGGLACIVHAVFPFLCQRTGSDAVRRLNATLCKRADKPNWERHPII